jgi:hypothetical protein
VGGTVKNAKVREFPEKETEIDDGATASSTTVINEV